MIEGEELGNAIDDNGNGLVDENLTHVPFGNQLGVSYSDRIDNDGDGESDSPVVTQDMIDAALSQTWGIWPLVSDEMQDGMIHAIGLDDSDLGAAYADGIDNNADPEDPYLLEYPIGLGVDGNSPLVDESMVAFA